MSSRKIKTVTQICQYHRVILNCVCMLFASPHRLLSFFLKKCLFFKWNCCQLSVLYHIFSFSCQIPHLDGYLFTLEKIVFSCLMQSSSYRKKKKKKKEKKPTYLPYCSKLPNPKQTIFLGLINKPFLDIFIVIASTECA